MENERCVVQVVVAAQPTMGFGKRREGGRWRGGGAC